MRETLHVLITGMAGYISFPLCMVDRAEGERQRTYRSELGQAGTEQRHTFPVCSSLSCQALGSYMALHQNLPTHLSDRLPSGHGVLY